MYRSKKKRNVIIFCLIGVLLCMAVGYAAFNTELKISGTSKVTSNWDIEIINVTEGTPVGSAENTVAPTWDALTASMEADLYEKGDAMEYDVTIENKGTIDAKLNDVLTNIENANSEAVNITFSGYTKGEILKAGSIKVIHVKIEYNPNYDGEETSSEVEINFDYEQNNNEQNNPDIQYLLTYDYSTNGGTSAELTEELIGSGSNVDLSNTATKEGWTFVGWNTNKDAEVGLENYQMPASNTTLYAIYSKTLKVTYEKGENIDSIGKNEDSCDIYNNQTSCEIILPEITSSEGYTSDGWYNGTEKVGKVNSIYIIITDTTLKAEASDEPYMMAYNEDYAFWGDGYRENIKTIDFLDSKSVPKDSVASWDVSDKQDGSVMAWVINDPDNSGYYKLYIGGTNGVIANEDSSFLFYSFVSANTMNFGNNFDTSRVINMSNMFAGSNNLITLSIDNWDTSNVTNMESMFSFCQSLTTLNLNDWDTGNVTNMTSMFYSSGMETLLINNWDTSNVTSMSTMFVNMTNLTELNLNGWDTSSVTNMSHMFYYSQNLTKLNLCSFDNSSVTSSGGFQRIFSSCTRLKEIYVGPKWVDNPNIDTWYSDIPTSGVIQSNNCEVQAEAISLSISTTSTDNNITVVANADADSGIKTYEYSLNGGQTWQEGNSNVYVFENLELNKSYNISVKVTSNLGKTLTKQTYTDILANVSTAGTGLYADEYVPGRYVYKGAEPNNYIAFGDKVTKTGYVLNDGTEQIDAYGVFELLDDCQLLVDKYFENGFCTPVEIQDYEGGLWRIISKESDGTYKIVRNNAITARAWDDNGNIIWQNATLNNYLNNIYYNNLDSSVKDYIVSHRWNVGSVIYYNNTRYTTFKEQQNEEMKTTYNANVGLINFTDYYKANSNPLACGSFELTMNHYSICYKTNWMANISTYYYWSINPFVENMIFSFVPGSSSQMLPSASNEPISVLPVVYLKSDIILTGTGTESNPYRPYSNKDGNIDQVEKPTFEESGTEEKSVTITYPEGCGDTLTCTYQKNNDNWIEVDTSTVVVNFEEGGTLVANVFDGTTRASSSYTVQIPINITNNVVTSGDGLYEDKYEEGKYTYKGANPNNYIYFNDELWRILSIDSDNNIKIIKNSSVVKTSWDTTGGEYGSKDWTRPSDLNTYLNGEYYNSLGTDVQNKIISHEWSIGEPTTYNDSLSSQIIEENNSKWTGKVGLITLSEYLRGNSNENECSNVDLLVNNLETCSTTNYLIDSISYYDYTWTITPYTVEDIGDVFAVFYTGSFTVVEPSNNFGVIPVVYVNVSGGLSGSGTTDNPYRLIS